MVNVGRRPRDRNHGHTRRQAGSREPGGQRRALVLKQQLKASCAEAGRTQFPALGQLVKVNSVPALAEGMLQSLFLQGQVAINEGMIYDAIRQYTSQDAAQAYYQVWNQ